MIRQTTTLVMGLVLGLGLAVPFVKGKHLVRKDSVTIERSELRSVIRALVLLEDQKAASGYRYQSPDGRVAFSCPTDKACNLELPARLAERSSESVAMEQATE